MWVAGGLTPTQQSLLFNMVHGLLPNYERLLKFGLGQSDQCNFCCQKDGLCHFLKCPQSSRNVGPNQVHPPGGNHRPKRTPLAAHSCAQPQPASHSSPPSDGSYRGARDARNTL